MKKAMGRRVTETREATGLTQQQLAERLGVSTKYLQAIEGGRQNVTVGTLVRVGNALGVPVRDLFDPPASLAARKPGRPPTRAVGEVVRRAGRR